MGIASPIEPREVALTRTATQLLKSEQPGAPAGDRSKGSGMPWKSVALEPIARIAGVLELMHEFPAKPASRPSPGRVTMCHAGAVPLAARHPAPIVTEVDTSLPDHASSG